ncbi:DUF4395 domain-containing protein [Natronomonas sp. EA1]|uniref:DUF4395 domain-containing protein n=1 Tax=Natronomonas sp. EA1 TaxID=3421655 RepID=UPI003EBE2B55
MSSQSGTPSVAMVDPRAPRFGQTMTTLGMAAFVVTGNPAPLYAVTAILLTSVATGWRVDMYGFLWKRVLIPVVGKPDQPEPASPHRFAKLMGATFTAIASVAVLAGFPVVALAVAAMVGLLAGVAAALDLCVGCRMYKQVRFFRELGVV